jgi:hypothetical protein
MGSLLPTRAHRIILTMKKLANQHGIPAIWYVLLLAFILAAGAMIALIFVLSTSGPTATQACQHHNGVTQIDNWSQQAVCRDGSVQSIG